MTDAQGGLRARREAGQAEIPQQAVRAAYTAGFGSRRGLGDAGVWSGEEEGIQALLGRREEGRRWVLSRWKRHRPDLGLWLKEKEPA